MLAFSLFFLSNHIFLSCSPMLALTNATLTIAHTCHHPLPLLAIAITPSPLPLHHHIVRVECMLSLKTDPITHSASLQARDAIATNLPLSLPYPHPSSLVLIPCLILPLVPLICHSKTPQHKPCQCHVVRTPSPPDDTHMSLDTGQVTPCMSCSTPCQSNVSAQGIQFFRHIVIYGIISFISICFHLSYFCV